MNFRYLISLLCCLFLAILFSCDKKEKAPAGETAVQTESTEGNSGETKAQTALDERVTMYRAAVYKDKDHKEWLATLNKAEQVILLEESTHTLKGKEEELAKVRLSDDTEGYIRLRYLADRAIVITEADTPVFARNNKASGEKGILPLGTVAFVVDEKADWLKVTAGELANGTKIYNRWINGGFSEDAGLIADAVMIESAVNVISGKSEGSVENAQTLLGEIAEKGNLLSPLAQSQLDGGEAPVSYEYPDGSILAKVTATMLNIRKEASVDAEQVAQAPKNSIVALLEEKAEVIEINGNQGKWTKINYNGTEGWAFGAHLDQM